MRSDEKDSADVEDRRVGDGSGLQLVISIFRLRLGNKGFRVFRDQAQSLEFGNLSLSMKRPGVRCTEWANGCRAARLQCMAGVTFHAEATLKPS